MFFIEQTKRKAIFIALTLLYILLIVIVNHIYGINNTASSRYYSSITIFLIPITSLILLYLKKIFNKKTILISCSVASIVLIYICFASFRDNYINDIQNTLQTYAVNSDYLVVPKKEETRTSDINFSYRTVISNNSEYISFFSEYRYWGHDIIVVRKEKKDSITVLPIPDGVSMKTFANFKTNKKGDSISVSMYSPLKIDSIGPDYSISEKNLFKNSDLEIQQNESDLLKNLQTWIDDGATFYNKPVLLPRYIDLSTQRHIPTPPFYPIAFSETDLPIEGKHSVHVIFNYENHLDSNCYIRLLHTIKSVPGVLSFCVKALKPNSQLIITKTDIDSTGKWLARTKYYVLLSDTQTHLLSFRFDSFSPSNYMFFIMHGVSADIVLDCIQFIPY